MVFDSMIDRSQDPVIEERKPRVDTRKIEQATRMILEAIGEDPNRPGLKDTPRRYAKFWAEFIGHQENNDATVFEDEADETGSQMVVVTDIRGWSMCEHHLMPFSYVAAIGYIANNKVLGLSKFPRIVKKVARQLQLQERICQQIVARVKEVSEPLGVAVVIYDSVHTCACARGVEAREMKTTTALFDGVFTMNAEARREFLEHVARAR